MEGFITLLIFAGLFYVMMRFGCGAHMVSGGRHAGQDKTEDSNNVDPVCGMEVSIYEGYGMMHNKTLYRFCSRKCMDTFESEPEKFTQTQEIKGGVS